MSQILALSFKDSFCGTLRSTCLHNPPGVCWGPSSVMLMGLGHDPIATHHPTPLPWSTACGLIVALTQLGYLRPSVSHQKQDFLPILNGSSATDSRCRFLASLRYPRRYHPDFGLWLFTWKDQASLYTLQGEDQTIPTHTSSTQNLLWQKGSHRSLSGFATQNIRMQVTPWKLQISSEQFCICPHFLHGNI